MSMRDKESKTTTITDLVSASHNSEVKSISKAVSERSEHDVVENSDRVSDFDGKNPVGAAGKNIIKLFDRLREQNMLVPGSDISREVQDDYRRIKRPLVSNACGRNKSLLERGNLILVTSSIPGEGKTYTSTNLALSISQEINNSVLLVDCDVAKQGVSRVLGIEKERGLVNVLENENLSIADVMLQTDVPNLRVMSAGKQSDYVAELLASQRMTMLLNEMADRYSDRIIILDGPPLLPTPQTQILAGLVGQVVFVIEAGKTPQALVEEALDLIPEDQATGLILNKNEGLSNRSGYYYGYYAPESIED